jgi:iron-sulfur cluster assembly protein/iron-sulfur cluster insertion protein
MIKLTDSAIKQITKLSKENAQKDQHLRIFVEAGGCSGFEYGMSFDSIKEGDNEIKEGAMTVLVDPSSLSYLEDCTIHFDDGLTGKGFEIKNPNASSTCGCGRSFN